MKRSLVQFVSLFVFLACGNSLFCEEDVRAPEPTDYGIPGTCPLWPIDQINGEYLYYAEYHPVLNCSQPTAAYLQGVYPWPVDCATAPHLCESDPGARVRTALGKSYPGRDSKVDHNYDPMNDLPEGPARLHATFDSTTRRKVRFLVPDSNTPKFAVVLQITVAKMSGNQAVKHTLYYGFETTSHEANNVVTGVAYIGPNGQVLDSGTSLVVRGGFEGQTYVIFLANPA